MPVGLVEVDALLLAELVDGHPGPGADEADGNQQVEPTDARTAREEPIKTDSEPHRRQTEKQQSERKSLLVHRQNRICQLPCSHMNLMRTRRISSSV